MEEAQRTEEHSGNTGVGQDAADGILVSPEECREQVTDGEPQQKKKKKKKKHRKKGGTGEDAALSAGVRKPRLRPVHKLRNRFYVEDDTRSLMLGCLDKPPPYLTENLFEAHEIIPNLFLGDYRAASQRDALKERRVTHVLNCARVARTWFPEVRALLPEHAMSLCEGVTIQHMRIGQDFTYHHLEIDDHPLEDILSHFERCCAFIAEARKDGAILVHWHSPQLRMAGISRSASVVVAYLIKCEGMPLQDALQLVKEKRAVVNPNPGFMEQLAWWEGMGGTVHGRTPAHAEYRKWKRRMGHRTVIDFTGARISSADGSLGTEGLTCLVS